MTLQNEIVFVCGRKGCGKTTLLNQLAQSHYFAKRRVIVLSPMGGIELPGAPVVYTVADFLNPENSGRSIVAIPTRDNMLPAAVFQYAFLCGDLWLIVDEVAIDGYGSLHGADEYLIKCVYYGRHHGVNLICATQRPADVIRNLTGQSDYIVCFHVEENRDLEYLQSRIGKENTERVQSLADYDFLTYTRRELIPGHIEPGSVSGGGLPM